MESANQRSAGSSLLHGRRPPCEENDRMKPSNDLSGLIKYLSRAEWHDRLEDVMGDHFAPIMTAFDIEYEEIGEILGAHWDRTLWGCAFEDFLTQSFEPDGINSVHVYITLRVWKEKIQSKRYKKKTKKRRE